MMKRFQLLILLLLNYFLLSAQEEDGYKNGYALKGSDTIKCMVQFNSKFTDSRTAVALLIGGDKVNFIAGGSITGFSVEENGTQYNYGVVDVEIILGRERRNNKMFVRKLAAGIIDFYEHTYIIYTTKRTTVNGEEKPGSATSSSQNYTNYYIAKKDAANPVLATPVILPSYRKKDLEIYLSDNPALFAREEKRYNLKELIQTIKEYNTAYLITTE